jgi:hypothetical protein
MDADWEVEIGGGAPVIEAGPSGSSANPESSAFIDLRRYPEHIVEIREAAAFPPLAALLLELNAPESPLWTSKCDLWEPEPAALASYIDMRPREGWVFAQWQQAEFFCREYVARLAPIAFPKCSRQSSVARDQESTVDSGPEYTIDLVIRQAIAGQIEGFGITAYLGARATTLAEAAAGRITTASALAFVMAGFADALPPARSPAITGSKLQ